MHYNIEFKLQNLLSNIVGLKYIDYEKNANGLALYRRKDKNRGPF